MIKDFLIISCIGQDDKLGLRINKDFFIHNFDSNRGNEKLVAEIFNLLELHKVKLDNDFSVIVNQGPGSFSGTRVSIAVVKGLKISKKVKIFGYKNTDLLGFNQKNIEKMLQKNLIEKNLIKPIYLS